MIYAIVHDGVHDRPQYLLKFNNATGLEAYQRQEYPSGCSAITAEKLADIRDGYRLGFRVDDWCWSRDGKKKLKYQSYRIEGFK